MGSSLIEYHRAGHRNALVAEKKLMAQTNELFIKLKVEYGRMYRVDAASLREEIGSRLTDQQHRPTPAFYTDPSGTSIEVQKIADDLERTAKMLPER